MKRNITKIKALKPYETISEQVEREKDRLFWMMQGLH
ncbi:MAG: hypothetical protein PWQ84_643 [Thermotogaceae bacterium]|jgi:hypothetical protein|nr:hypothetical protein [Thermotogaceae bacterium]